MSKNIQDTLVILEHMYKLVVTKVKLLFIRFGWSISEFLVNSVRKAQRREDDQRGKLRHRHRHRHRQDVDYY